MIRTFVSELVVCVFTHIQFQLSLVWLFKEVTRTLVIPWSWPLSVVLKNWVQLHNLGANGCKYIHSILTIDVTNE